MLRARGRTTRRVGARQPTATPGPWDEEEAALVKDLAVLLDMGLIVAFDDGCVRRYAMSGVQQADQ
jgi:hypothetical protein